MGSAFGFAQQKQSFSTDNLGSVPKEALDHRLDAKGARPALNKRQKNNTDGFFEWRKLVKLSQNKVWICATLDFYHQANRFAHAHAALIADTRNTSNLFVANQISNRFCQAISSLLVRNFLNDDLSLVALFNNHRPGTKGNFAPARHVAFNNALPATDNPTCREIGTRKNFHNLRN